MKIFHKIAFIALLLYILIGKTYATDFFTLKNNLKNIVELPYLNDSIRQSLQAISEVDSATLQNEDIYRNFNNFLLQLQANNYKVYYREQYYDIIEGFRLLLHTQNNEEIAQMASQWLPQDYTVVKALIPAYITRALLEDAACTSPKECIRQYAGLMYIGDTSITEIVHAIAQFPSYSKQFLHYNNNIKTLCITTKDTLVQNILRIYDKYKFSSNAYYLTPYIINSKYSLDSVHTAGQDIRKLLKLCSEYKITSTDRCYNSTDEKYAELSERYLRKIKIQRNSPIAQWDLEELSDADVTTIFYFLVFNQNSMDNKEISKFILWTKNKAAGRLSANILKKEQETLLHTLDERSKLIGYRDSISALFENGVWNSFFNTQNIVKLSATSLSVTKNKPELPNLILPKYTISPHSFTVDEAEKDKIFLYNNPEWVLDHMNMIGKKSYGKDILFSTAKNYPLEFLMKADSFVLMPYGMDILKNICRDAPLTAKNFIINPNHKLNALMHYLSDSVIHILFDIHASQGSQSKAYLLLDQIYHKNISIAQADSLTENPETYVPLLIDNLVDTAALGHYSTTQDLSAKALKFIRTYNISENTDLAEQDMLSTLSTEQLYIFMILGEEEIIYSTFKKMFYTWQTSVPNKVAFLKKMNYYGWSTFYRKCAFYGLESELLQNTNSEDMMNLVSHLYPKDITYILDPVIETAEIIYYSTNRILFNDFEKKTKIGYETAEKEKNERVLAAYTILAGFLGEKMDDENWSYYVHKQYSLPNYSSISNYAVFNQNMTNVQQYFFYNDEDGIGSYNNFIKTYQKSKSDWTIEDKNTYVKISSIYGKKIEMYANKPTSGDKGMDDIELFFRDEHLAPSIVVHRGLSTHTLKTFNKIPAGTLLILDGSCGGYHIQQVALSRAPTAQIMCNRNVGSMYINDPIFKQLNEEIRQGNTIVWQDFWNKIKQKVGSNPYFYDYIPPDKNIYAQLTTAYLHLLNIK